MSYVLNPGSSSGTIGGTIAQDQIAYGSATDTITGSDNLKYDPTNKKVTIKTDGVTDTVVLESTDAGSTDHAPDLKLYRNSASPATNDKLGEIRFAGNKNDGTEYAVTKITAEMNTIDSSDRLSFDVASSGGGGQQNFEYMRFDGGIRDIVFNEGGQDIDFRIEGQSNQDLFLTDATQDAVAIGIPLGSMSSTLFQVGAPMSIVSANSVSNLDIKFAADTDTGIFSPGLDQISFAVSGADALGVGANKNITVGGSSGTAGQVLTSGGSGGATTWTTLSSGGGQSPKGFIPQGNFTAQNLAQSRPWGTNRSSTSSSSDSNPSCRPFFISQAGTVATMLIRVTGGTSGNYLAGIYSDDGGKPDTLLGQASFAVSGGSGQRTATSFTAADGVTSRTITLAADTQYWYATVKESGNGSIQSTDPTRTPTVMQDDNTNVGNNWYMSVRDSSISNAFEDTWDVSSSSPSTFIPGSVWVIMS